MSGDAEAVYVGLSSLSLYVSLVSLAITVAVLVGVVLIGRRHA